MPTSLQKNWAVIQLHFLLLQVYPCAEHTRYQHCMGVAWLSMQLAKHLSDTMDSELLGSFHERDVQPSQEDLLRVALAGAAHDLGHGPYSHLWERSLENLGVKGWCVTHVADIV